MQKLIVTLMALFSIPLVFAAEPNCDFDADDADSPNFIQHIKDCENKSIKLYEVTGGILGKGEAVELYDSSTTTDSSGIKSRPVVAPGTLNHHPGSRYIAREYYSVKTGGKFEETVMFAMQRLHGQMAQYCAQGWKLERQWSDPVSKGSGDYYLYHQFTCAETDK